MWDEFYGQRKAVNLGSSGDRTYVDEKTVHWLDIDHVFLDEKGNLKRDLMPDGLHPDEEGYRAWGKATEPAIRKFVGENRTAEGTS